MKYTKKTNINQTTPLLRYIPSLVAGVVIASLSASVSANQLNSKLQTSAQVEQALTALLDSRDATLQLASYTGEQSSMSVGQAVVRQAATKKVDHSQKSVAELVLAGLAITNEAKDELSSSAPTIEPPAAAVAQDYTVADIEMQPLAQEVASNDQPESVEAFAVSNTDEIDIVETEASASDIAVVETEVVEAEAAEIAAVQAEYAPAGVTEAKFVQSNIAEADVAEEVAPKIVNLEESAPIQWASVSTSASLSAPTTPDSAQDSTPETFASDEVTNKIDTNVSAVTRSAGCPEDFNKVSIPVNGKMCQIFAADFPASMILFIPQTPEEVIHYYLASSANFVEPKTIKQRTMLKSADNNTTLIISKDGGGTQVDILVKSPVI